MNQKELQKKRKMPIKKKRYLTIAMYTENHKQSRLAKSKTSRIQKQNKSIKYYHKKRKRKHNKRRNDSSQEGET